MFSQFKGLFPVQKTLRFELRPQQETKKFLKLSEDFLRAEYYPKLKEVLDDYYRDFIEEVLSVVDIGEDIELDKCFDLYNAAKKDKTAQAKKEYKKVADEVCKRISKLFKDSFDLFSLEKDGFKELLKKGSKLFNWLDNRMIEGVISKEKYDIYVEAINAYIGYATCLQGFNNNRKNIFEETGATSIANRTIENMERYFENCNTYRRLIDKYKDIDFAFEGVETYFMPKNYFLFVAQSQIDKYNEIIGHASDDINAKGVNQKLNEYAQKCGFKRREVPMMSVLYKQILSDRQSFIIDKIENDKNLISLVCEADKKFKETLTNIINIVAEGITADNFITVKSLTDISARLYNGENAWAILNSALKLYCEKIKIKKDVFNKFVSIGTLQKATEEYAKENGIVCEDIISYFCSFSTANLTAAREKFASFQSLTAISSDRQAPSDGQIAGKGYMQVQTIKNLLDCYVEALRFFKPLYLVIDGKKEEDVDNDVVFYNQFVYEYEKLSDVIPIYNKIRNYLTTVTKIDKTKVRNFLGSSSLLTGWAEEYKNNGCYIFGNDADFYLVDVIDKKGIDFSALEKSDGKTWKVNYSFVKLDSKNFIHMFFNKGFYETAKKYKDYEKVKNIYENKMYLKSAPITEKEYKNNLISIIDYFKYSLSVHESCKDIEFSFKDSSQYQNIQEFYNDASKYGYDIEKVSANFEYLKQLEKENKVLLFQIYCKDFSKNKKGKGTPNLHTLYLKELFSDENLQRIRDGKPFIQLNGGAQIYTRRGSIEPKITHRKNVPVDNKNPLNKKRESVFEYDLIKDKRFTEDKMFLHFPITLNSGTQPIRNRAFNETVNKFLRNNPNVNIIGLDRGERHLLYYSVIDHGGNILEQGSFNTLENDYQKTDYHALLDSKEKARDLARKTWGKIEAIAPIKEGYLSNVVYKLTRLMIKHNAVLVLENLNKGMKNSRKKVEKQVYQKFEHAIIDKLNYLVFKERSSNEELGALNGYQLTDKLEKYEDIGKQNGFLIYVDPAYTSKICPKTGFVDYLRPEYTSVEKAREYFSLFDYIRYNKEKDYFEFGIDYDKFGDYKTIAKKQWTICSFGERYVYNSADKSYSRLLPTEELKKLFVSFEIDYRSDDLKKQIVAAVAKQFFERLIYLLKTTLQLRNTVGGESDDNDYILSPVMDKDGKFFDSRNAADDEPKNADANGAYHIALKGLWTIEHISEDGALIDCSLEDWFGYRQ